ncbi:ComEC/Rec2 family competence protein [Flavisolibacter ginsenosidimutans]|uniref:ComEC family competence protein n=1 Tax=Flavisolibacter ginsenosidimutans TaxID=661481 RepID=A0A5B8ULF8_9BACT|nr:ComEC/Rec2 family competence protein [Flavisolibacter ginsenosidimutans]QEC57202.1 ComEC family competence protein [Flavisolibacter ginsenosidimutans]
MAARLWHKAPFVRLLTATAVGIVLQWNVQLSLSVLLLCFGVCFLFAGLYSFTGIRKRYQLSAVNGTALCLLFVAGGGLLVWQQDVRNNKHWIGCEYKAGNGITVKLEEPLVEKANSYKALASFESLNDSSSAKPVKGNVILYFKKDSLPPSLQYGSRILFNRPLQEIKNAGNPGSFDYKTYCLFNGITHQVYLSGDDFVLLPGTDKSVFTEAVFACREWVVGVMKKYIPGEKEQGLAEALLIGYKDDLDKNLVQAYSNTGVVHIIAISGLHLGLIYWLLMLLTKPLKRAKKLVAVRLLLVIASLWLFSILAGAQPSVLRSAVMFSLIAAGELALRRTNFFNTLAFSALVLLCINPFWLWDVGFQLSYTAVLSIVLFFQPVYNWFHLTNKAVDFFWKLTAVTISAQVLTIPISVYHFHQMPLLFLFTNFIAVPLSSLVVLGEILLCAVSFFTPLAALVGAALHHLIYWMNSYIERLNNVPFSVWNGLSINLVQTLLLLIFVVAICYWLMEKQRRLAWTALSSFAVFMLIRTVSFSEAERQQKLVVYNVPKHTAIDVINGRNYAFLGDTSLLYDDFARNFHLQPSRILHRVSAQKSDADTKSFLLNGKQVVVMNETMPLVTANPKLTVDVLILSRNPKLYISKVLDAFVVKQIVIDGSVPAWKAALWKRDCDSLRIPCYNVSEDGAFVMNW